VLPPNDLGQTPDNFPEWEISGWVGERRSFSQPKL